MTLGTIIEPEPEDARAYAQASGDLNPIHTDRDAAVAAGLPGPIMHGLWTMAKLAQALTATSGRPALALARLRVEFRDYVLPEVSVDVDLTENGEPGGWTITAEQSGRLVARGSGEVRSA